MERLTFTDEEMCMGLIDCPVRAEEGDRVSQLCDEICSEFQNDCPYMKMGQKLKTYEDAEEQGLLIRLPCKVGDTVYYIEDYYIYSDKVDSIDIRKENEEYIYCIAFMDYRAENFGKTVFLTREEAEAKLAEMQKG